MLVEFLKRVRSVINLGIIMRLVVHCTQGSFPVDTGLELIISTACLKRNYGMLKISQTKR